MKTGTETNKKMCGLGTRSVVDHGVRRKLETSLRGQQAAVHKLQVEKNKEQLRVKGVVMAVL